MGMYKVVAKEVQYKSPEHGDVRAPKGSIINVDILGEAKRMLAAKEVVRAENEDIQLDRNMQEVETVVEPPKELAVGAIAKLDDEVVEVESIEGKKARVKLPDGKAKTVAVSKLEVLA